MAKGKRKSLHVVKGDKGWEVRREGAKRPSHRADRQTEAVKWARKKAREEKGDVTLHRSDGKIRSKQSYAK